MAFREFLEFEKVRLEKKRSELLKELGEMQLRPEEIIIRDLEEVNIQLVVIREELKNLNVP